MRFKGYATTCFFGFLIFAGYITGAEVREWPFYHMATISARVLDDGWLLACDSDDLGLEEGWYEPVYPRDGWEPADVPGVWGTASGEPLLLAESKVGWYALDVKLPADSEGEPALVFLGSMYITDVWFDGGYLGSNTGGYTPFLFCLGEHLKPGGAGTLVVRVDNRMSNQTIPKAATGWNTYGGLTREVFLLTRPSLRVEDLRTVSRVRGAHGPVSLSIAGQIENNCEAEFAGMLRLTLEADGEAVAGEALDVSVMPGQVQPFDIVLDVPRARLWSPDDPFLHVLKLRLGDGEEPHIRMPVGLREVKIDGPHFLLNGERLWLQGFGQHEMVAGHGPCGPPGWYEKELARMKRFGANHYRTGHYPQHPEVFAAADRLGLLVFTEIPVWQLGRGWIQSERAWEEWAKPQLSAMIRWYRNFTSVISWGAANEMSGTPQYNRRAVDFISGKDPERLPMIVMAAGADMEALYDLLPMAGRNFHYGWYHSRRVYGLRAGLEQNLEHAERADVPIWVAELGAQAHPGRFTGCYGDRSRGSETYLEKVVRFGFQYNAVTAERVCGIAIWTWSDFIRRDRIEPHGIFGYGMEPKLAAYTIRNLFEGDLRLFLAEEDTDCRPGGLFRADCFVFNPRLLSLPSGLNVKWQVLKGGAVLAEGGGGVPAGVERAVGAGTVEWRIPDDAAGMYSLWAELTDGAGQRLHTNVVHFGVRQEGSEEVAAFPGALLLTATAGGRPVDAEVLLGGIRLPVYADPGLYIPLCEGRYELEVSYGGRSRTVTVAVHAGQKVVKTVDF